eukprot:5103031-Ditylum_brightwellii.AAC.1
MDERTEIFSIKQGDYVALLCSSGVSERESSYIGTSRILLGTSNVQSILSTTNIYVEKWSRIETIYRMHTQLLRYYDYLIDDNEDDGDGKHKCKKKKNIHQRRQVGRFST